MGKEYHECLGGGKVRETRAHVPLAATVCALNSPLFIRTGRDR